GFQLVNEQSLRGRTVISSRRKTAWIKAVLRADDDYKIWRMPKTVWLDGRAKNFRRPGAASVLGVPQVILNYAPVAREPWRLKAVIDEEGIAASSRFLVFRPKPHGLS